MKNKILSLFTIALLISTFSFAQGICGTYEGSFKKQQEKYPDFYQKLSDKNNKIEKEYFSAISKMTSLKTENGKIIIPVVVHVIHDLGPENLSNQQIQFALDELNRNINGQASNFLARTPDVFASVRGSLGVEFRLAKKDPNGLPTTGVNRIQSSMTFEPTPRNAVKALSYWSSYKYFNIWTLRKFAPQNDGNTLLGFAQFPWSGSMSTDGVVLLASQMASGGTLTHEVGHWLGLRHVWGDANCGDDGISDTPPAREPNYGITFNDFPYHAGLAPPAGSGLAFWGCIADTLNPAGEMFMNYMDYTPDQFCTMFSKGQVEIMKMHLGMDGDDNEIAYREYLCSHDNILATGTEDGHKPPICTQKPVFSHFGGGTGSLCEGETLIISGSKGMFGNQVSSYVWDFGNGDTDSSGDTNVFYTYNSPGQYDVKLTVQFTEITEARAKNLSDLDVENATEVLTDVRTLIVQSQSFEELDSLGAKNILPHQIDTEFGAYFAPVYHFWRGELNDTVYIAKYSNSCTTETIREKFVNVYPTSAVNSTNNIYTYSFESNVDTASINDASDGDWFEKPAMAIESPWSFDIVSNSSWERVNGVGNDGTSSLKINGNQVSYGTHEIISTSYDLSQITNPGISFSWAGASKNTFPEDRLIVYYSDDCGDDWNLLESLSPVQISSAGLYHEIYNDPQSSEWSKTIMSKPQLKKQNIQFKFVYEHNAPSNNFYLDNIQIGDTSSLKINQNNAKFSIYPNPTNGNTNFVIDNLSNEIIKISVVNILGEDVMRVFEGEVLSDIQTFTANLSILENGVYFIKAINNSEIIFVEKLILRR